MLFFLILIQMVEFHPFGKIDDAISEYCMFVGRFRRGGFNNKAQEKEKEVVDRAIKYGQHSKVGKITILEPNPF